MEEHRQPNGGPADQFPGVLAPHESSSHLREYEAQAVDFPGSMIYHQPEMARFPPGIVPPPQFFPPSFSPPNSSGYAASGYGGGMPFQAGHPSFADVGYTGYGLNVPGDMNQHSFHIGAHRGYGFDHDNIQGLHGDGHVGYNAGNPHDNPVNPPYLQSFADSNTWSTSGLTSQDSARALNQGITHDDPRGYAGNGPAPGLPHLGLSQHYGMRDVLHQAAGQGHQDSQPSRVEHKPDIKRMVRNPGEEPRYAYDPRRSKEEVERLVREHEPRGHVTVSEQIPNALRIGRDFDASRKIHGLSLEELIKGANAANSRELVDQDPIPECSIEDLPKVNVTQNITGGKFTEGGNPDHGSAEMEGQAVEHVDAPSPVFEKPKSAHKRPNQAQRRRMNRQLDLGTPSASEASYQQREQAMGPHTPQHTQQPTRGLHHQNSQQRSSSNWWNEAAASSPHRRNEMGSSNVQSTPTGSMQSPPSRRPDNARDWRGGAGPQAQRTFSGQGGSPYQQQQQQRDRGRFVANAGELKVQFDFLTETAQIEVTASQADPVELERKESFRAELEVICRDALIKDAGEHPNELDPPLDPSGVKLECFGSLKSGFATKSSDMDLVLISPKSHPLISTADSRIPRILEKCLLGKGYGARLLTKTRVPIIKLCQKPTPELLDLLLKARQKWEDQFAGEASSEKDTGGRVTVTGEQRHAASQDKAEASAAELDVSQFQEMKLHDSDEATSGQLLAQNPNESLWEYNCRARNLLKKLGGRDVTLGEDDLNSDERVLLNTATEGFVGGIRDEGLKRAISAALPKGFIPSLYGAWLLAEGEHLIIGWDARVVHEGTGEDESFGYKLIQEWRRLPLRGGMKLGEYNDELRKIWDRLKQFPSLKLQILTQRSDEPIEAYGIRTRAVLRELGVRDFAVGKTAMELHPTHGMILHTAVLHYVEGIYDHVLRDYVRKEVSDDTVNLAEVVSIHLVEHYIKKHKLGESLGIYTGEERILVERYETLVRTFGIHYPEVTAMADKIRSLPDPFRQNRKRAFATDPLEFPKTGVGIQCDINFSNTLAVHNTLLLRCYHLSDPRVRPMVIFIKSWAKKRMINNAYLGTLCSYGYVLMILHYLLNIASPGVLTNLQTIGGKTAIDQGCNVTFWRDEDKIQHLASTGQLTDNKESLGFLLRGFFEYYSHNGPHVIRGGFSWTTEVVSISTKGGLVSKEQKGWTGAKTVVMGDKEIRQRYLLAIEDPFETGHNVGRTVNHQGIIAIRDEFRRAWRIITAIGKGHKIEEGLLDEVPEKAVRD